MPQRGERQQRRRSNLSEKRETVADRRENRGETGGVFRVRFQAWLIDSRIIEEIPAHEDGGYLPYGFKRGVYSCPYMAGKAINRVYLENRPTIHRQVSSMKICDGHPA